MGSPIGNRKLADQLRAKLLVHANKIMDGDDEEAKNKLLEKMGNALLPRLTEVTGANGGAIEVKQITGMIISDENQIHNQDSDPDTSSESVD